MTNKVVPFPEHFIPQVLPFILRIFDTLALQEMLAIIVNEAPRIIACDECSIFLLPDLFDQFDGELVDQTNNKILANHLSSDFVVLAKFWSSQDLHYLPAKHFYRSGEGLTGWAFKNRKSLFLTNMADPAELATIDKELRWEGKYHPRRFVRQLEDPQKKRPFLAVPLVGANRCYGVIRLAGSSTANAFPQWSEHFLTLCSRAITNRAEVKLSAAQKQKSLENFLAIGIMDDTQRLFQTITAEAKQIMDASACHFYTIDQFAEKLNLQATTLFTANSVESISRNDGIIGWIFKTGYPFRINDLHRFSTTRFLTDEALNRYSDYCPEFSNRAPINTIDRYVQPSHIETMFIAQSFTRFLGVPVFASQTSHSLPHAVILLLSTEDRRIITRTDLRVIQDFARIISLLFQQKRQMALSKLLLDISKKEGKELFQYVCDNLPRLVHARGCSIFFISEHDKQFHLKYTNSPKLMTDTTSKQVLDLKYPSGVGKTGLVAKLGRTLLLNDYGPGGPDNLRLAKIYRDYLLDPEFTDKNLVGILNDNRGNHVGLARLLRLDDEGPFSEEEKHEFSSFVKDTVYTDNEGLECHETTKLCEEGPDGGYSRSFLSTPIKDKLGTTYGVLRIPRSYPGGVFSDDDINLVLSVARRLSSFVELEQNLLTLSELNSQINASFGTADLDKLLRSILLAVTDRLGFEFVTIQLVDSSQKTISYAMGRSNPAVPGAKDPETWSSQVHYPLYPTAGLKDIQAWLVTEHQRPFIVKGWDEHFNRKIYEEFNHENLIRVFVPMIISNTNEPIGTIEAGFDVSRRSNLNHEDREVVMLNALSNAAAIAINNRRINESLLRAQKLALIPDITHLLRSPSATLTMLLQEIANELKQESSDLVKISRYIDLARRSTMQMELLSKNLSLRISEASDLDQKTKVNFKSILSDAKKSLEGFDVEIVSENELDFEFYFALSPVEKSRAEVILLNILHNAVKFSPPGGQIRISCLATTCSTVNIVVKDDGPGIPEGMEEKIFLDGTARRSKDWPEGSGIGLQTVKRYCDELGWKCWTGNSRSGGAEFTIETHILEER